jgi:hypothetical protein
MPAAESLGRQESAQEPKVWKSGRGSSQTSVAEPHTNPTRKRGGRRIPRLRVGFVRGAPAAGDRKTL